MHYNERFYPKKFIDENSMQEIVYRPISHERFWGEIIIPKQDKKWNFSYGYVKY